MDATSTQLDPARLARLIRLAYEEDVGSHGDLTSALLPRETEEGRVAVTSRQSGVFAGQPILASVLATLCEETAIKLDNCVEDGRTLHPGVHVCTLTGRIADLLLVERTVLNFLGRLCGVATLTRAYVDAVASTQARIYDTRKTVPGWRELDKYAVRCGGGWNHRMGLHDAVLIKDNHIANVELPRLADAIAGMCRLAREQTPCPSFIEVEVDTLDQFQEVLKVQDVDIVLLDNFSASELSLAVELRDASGRRGQLQLEASGGVNLETVATIARTGVDRIAVGALTHSAPALDLGMDRIS